MSGRDGLEGKRAKVTGGVKRGTSSKGTKRPPTTPIVLACVAVVIGAFAVFGPKFGQNPAPAGGGTASQKQIQMTDLTATVADGKIAVPVATVKEKGLVRFTYKGTTEIPLLAYVAPSGKVVTAVSMCEPCSSTRFFIDGDKIICSSCGTEWDLETLKGIKGGCTAYPPDRVTNTISGDIVRIDETSVAGWKSRI